MQPRDERGRPADGVAAVVSFAGTIGRSARAFVVARWPEIAASLVAALLYLPAVGFGFVFDDAALIAADGSPLAVGPGVPYRPLRYASYLVDSWLGGTPAVYHAHNVLLHALVAALAVALARRLGSARAAALAGGLLVATHPLAVEAAAYVSGRRDLLCVALGLAAVLAHLSGRFVTALGLVVLATAAKESGLVFLAPLAAATIAGLDGCAVMPGRRALAIAAAAAAACAALALVYGAIGPWIPAAGLVGLALPGRVVAHYVGTFAGATTLSPEYPELLRYVESVRGGDVLAAAAGFFLTVVVAAAAAASLMLCVRARFEGIGRLRFAAEHRLAARRRRLGREGAFVFAWTMATVVALAAWGGLHEPGADRHAYLLLPPLGVALAVVLTRLESLRDGQVRRAARSWRTGASHRAAKPQPSPLCAALVAGVVVALVGCASASRHQMETWRTERALWSRVTANPDASARAHANMARVLATDGRYRAAVRQMNLAITAAPQDPLMYASRAAVRCAQDRRFLARRDLHSARRLGAAPALLSELTRECDLAVARASGPAA